MVKASLNRMKPKAGVIQIPFGNGANGMIAGQNLKIRQALDNDAPVVPVAWVCAGAPVPGGMTVVGEDLTNLPPSVLPFNCH